MKTKSFLVITSVLLAASSPGAPLMETTAILSVPDTSAQVIGYFKAGTDPVAAANVFAPPGWLAVELPNPQEAYVNNNDFSKSLDVHAGAAIRLRPKADAPVLCRMQEGDKIEVTGLRSGWTQIKLYRTVVGYIRPGGTTPASVAGPAAGPVAPPPRPAPAATPPANVGPAAALPQTLQGVLVETKRFLLVGRRPDYDYQLNDANGKRIAYLDVGKIVATQKIELCLDQTVTVAGVIEKTGDWKDIVVVVQTLEKH